MCLKSTVIIKQISNIQYNNLNLPNKIDFIAESSKYISYLYTADGAKINVETHGGASQQSSTDYTGNIIYENGELLYIITAEGRLTLSSIGTSSGYDYYLTDHLGNTRVTFNQNGEVLQTDSYYPFGMSIESLSNTNNALENKYKYNGKEFQDDFDLDWYAYGFRMYDPQIGRFPSLDPKAEEFAYLSPYNYASNNPSTNIDLWGLQGISPRMINGTANKNTSKALEIVRRKYRTSVRSYVMDNKRKGSRAEADFAIKHPIAAYSIGTPRTGQGLAGRADRFAKALAPNNEPLENTLRHVIGQALITKVFGKKIAKEVSIAHGDDNPNNTEIDSQVDTENNIIGRTIGEENKFASPKKIAKIAIEKATAGELSERVPTGATDVNNNKIQKKVNSVMTTSNFNKARETLKNLNNKGNLKK